MPLLQALGLGEYQLPICSSHCPVLLVRSEIWNNLELSPLHRGGLASMLHGVMSRWWLVGSSSGCLRWTLSKHSLQPL